jgi:hypothetical protein
VIDEQTGLMWARQDNGEPLDWFTAGNYCATYAAGRHDDWRLPTAEELLTLLTDETNPHGYRTTRLIKLSAYSLWSSEERNDDTRYRPPGAAIYVDFSAAYYAGEPMLAYKSRAAEVNTAVWPHLRVLPVREAQAKPADPDIPR